ncbi:MAG: chemotaxis protein CheA [Gammaproteobacteria bacterium]|nr:chemotaxis protein CheA [Gammaproteobacteria bacterium]MCF6261674.1 chemotaxis protein CheA [Gammaproteobacteria bacterium]
MSMDEDQELLQDFLVEAGEILELLNEQLVDLEQRPKDSELLNAVFRGFHTIKGGASFLSLTALVDICHRAEDVFNALRNGERDVDANLMDVILPVVDVVNEQFDEIRTGQEPTPAAPELLAQLEGLLLGNAAEAEPTTEPTQEVTEKVSDEDADAEFEAIIDAAQNAKHTQGKPANNTEEFSEDEFEALLDQLHGEGKHAVVSSDKLIGTTTAADSSNATEKPKKNESSDIITDNEFEALLDQLQGTGTPAAGQSPASGKAENNAAEKIPEQKKPTVDVVKKTETKKSKAPTAVKDAPAQQAETTVRVDTKRLDDIMNMVGELVLVRNRVATLGLAIHDDEMAKVVSNLDVVTADLQSAIMKTRMQPIKKVFGRFPRVVRDLARTLKKEVNLEMQGEDTDLDKNLVEALADPLVHLVRNAVDHGIETPEQREAVGKPRAGTVILTAEQEGDHILLLIQDDGKGMNPDNLRNAAVEKGMMDAETAARLEDRECFNLIFAPGFSTKQEISDVSGRGVGMDVVKTRIEQLNGTAEIDSEEGRGSIIRIQVPLTLAIMPTLMVKLDAQIFALPLASVNEIFHLDLTRTNTVDGQLVVMVRDKALPLFYLRRWLVAGAAYDELPEEGHVVVVSIGAQRVGFVVDKLIGQEEVVIKPLGALLHGMKGLAGATITGDGKISLILDLPGLMHTYTGKN